MTGKKARSSKFGITITLLPGNGIGPEITNAMVRILEAVPGKATDIAGKGVASPEALLRSAVLILQSVGHPGMAGKADHALRTVLREGRYTTTDLGGKATTGDMCRAIIRNL